MKVTRALLPVLAVVIACNDAHTGADAAIETFAVDLTIAGPEGATAADGFGSISGLAFLESGDVFVSDALNHVVHRFDANGAHRTAIGRQGSGPGEFTRPCCVAVDKRNRLWVRDTDGGFDVFQVDGDSIYFLRRVRMPHTDVNRHAPVTFDAAGNVIDIGSRTDAATGTWPVYRFHLDSTGHAVREVKLHAPPEDSTAIREIRRSIPSGTITHYLYQPYGPAELTAHGPRGEFAHALSSRYAIDWRDSDGNLIRHIAVDMPKGAPLSSTEKASADTVLMQAAAGVGLAVRDLGFSVPATKPPLRSLFFDHDGKLWVELSVAEGAPRTAHVYAIDGTLERTVHWPANVSLVDGAIRDSVAWGVARDELGVQTLVRLTRGR